MRKLHDQSAIIQIYSLLNIHQKIHDKTRLFLYFLRLYKIEKRIGSQKINIIAQMLNKSVFMGKEFVMSWNNKDEAESV